MSPRRLALVFIVAFAARAAFLLAMGPQPRYTLAPDSQDYIPRARNLSRFHAFSASEKEPLLPDTFRTPGYPAFLAAFCSQRSCPENRAVVWAQAVLGAATAALLALACWLLFSDARAALAAGLGLSLDLATVLHTGLLLTETLFTFAFSLAFLAFAWAYRGGPQRAGRAALAGFLFGLTALVRPAGLYFFLFGAAALAWAWGRRRGAAAAAALFVAGSLIVPVAWMCRNKAAVGRWSFCSIQGLNISYMRAAGVVMELEGLDHNSAEALLRGRIQREHGGPFADESEESAFAGPWAARFIARHPIAYAKLMAKDTVKMMGGHGLEIASWTVLHDPEDDPLTPRLIPGGFSGTQGLVRRHPGFAAAIFLYLSFLAATYLLALGGFLTALRQGQAAEAAVGLSPILYFLALSAGALAYYRLRLPMMPAVFLFAGRGAAEALRRRAKA